MLDAMLKTTDRIVQEIDSVEYGLTDIQEYYANTGAFKAAAESARNGSKVGVSIVEAFGKVTPCLKNSRTWSGWNTGASC